MTAFSNRLLIGTYTNKKRGGIYLFDFSAEGALHQLQHVADTDNPSYLGIHPNKKFIYAVNEGGGADALVSAFKLDHDHISFLNKTLSGGDHPCYISIHPSGKFAAVANYSGGNMTVLPVAADGQLKNFVTDIHHKGQGTFLKRQEKPHAHAAVFSKDGNTLFLNDLGLDKIFYYHFDATRQLPLSQEENAIEITAAGGPRHLCFHPTLPLLYVIEELSGNVAAYKKVGEKYQLHQRIIASDDNVSDDKGSADIHITYDGKFLYVSNRGKANNLAIFKIAADGKLELSEHVSTKGEQPRNFVIHPSGEFLLVANQKTDNLVVFKRNKKTGSLSFLDEISVPNPVCLKFL
jgi:6-phosphogluconolactonase